MAFSGLIIRSNIGVVTLTLFYVYSRIKQISHYVNITKNQDFIHEEKKKRYKHTIKEIK